jgi:hypothetical protein
MRSVVMFVLVAVLVLFAGNALQAQSMQETLEKLSADAAKAYVNPIVSAFGSNLNGGWFHRAPAGKIFGFDLELGVVAMGTYMADADKEFNVSGAFKFSYDEAYRLAQNTYPAAPSLVLNELALRLSSETFTTRIYGPTVVGSKDQSVKVSFPGRTYTVSSISYTIPNQEAVLQGVSGVLEEVKMVPLFAPQASIGTIFGTQLSFRYLPDVELSPEVGKMKYFGFGIQHNPDVWLGGMLPVDLALAFYSQSLKVGDLPFIEAKTTAYGINVSKQLGLSFLNITPYAGFMLESSTLTFKYDFETVLASQVVRERVSFDLEGQNKSRIVLGASIRLLILNANIDYNIGKYKSVTAGVMFII